MRRCLRFATLFLSAAALAASSPTTETPEAQKLGALAPDVIYLCGFAVGFQRSPKLVASWRALQDPSLNTDSLIRLLKSEDPRIRALAIFALDRKDDPHLLPYIAPLQADTAPAYDCPLPVAQPLDNEHPERWPHEPSTVGGLAAEIVLRYLTEAGYTNFDGYWLAHKGRSYSLSWFVLGLRRVWSFDPLIHPTMDDLRRDVSRLPVPDRQWTSLFLGTLPNPNRVPRPYSDDELLHAASELGHSALIQLLNGHVDSTDPDLRDRNDYAFREPYFALTTFVLKHSPTLLLPADSGFLLQEKFAKSPWHAIAAAQLDSAHASDILRSAYNNYFPPTGDYERATLMFALWNLKGPSQLPLILDWFYNSSLGHGWYATPRAQFLRDAESQNNTRALIASIIRDPRFDSLDWNSLDALVRLIAHWTGKRASKPYPEVDARSNDPAIRNPALAEYRRRLRDSLPLWAPNPLLDNTGP